MSDLTSSLNSVSLTVMNPWGIHARPSACIALIGLVYFSDWDVIVINKDSGKEANAKSVSEIMQLAIPCGGKAEFISIMPDTVWEKYIKVLFCLSRRIESGGNKSNETAYGDLFATLPHAGVNQMSCDECILKLEALLRAGSHRPFFEPVMFVATPFTENSRKDELVDIISGGEDETTEFKSTLRFNLYSKKNDEDIEHSVLKTIGAFLNSEGGTLLIGVDDKGNVIGLDSDGFQNADKMMQHLINLVKEHIGAQHARCLKLTIREINGKQVLQVLCARAMTPAYVVHKNRKVAFVRIGPTTTELPVNEVYSYIKHRFAGLV